jgi:pantetheine-phosphate adenylyltransferase
VKVALIPGSFDPFHNGHLAVVQVAARNFDQVVVAAVRNPGKEPLFSLEDRELMLKECLEDMDNVSSRSFSGLVVDLATEIGATAIVKGLRAVSDLEHELQMAQMNYQMSGIDTLFVPATSSASFLASKYIKDFAKGGRVDDVAKMVPAPVARRLADKFGSGR